MKKSSCQNHNIFEAVMKKQIFDQEIFVKNTWKFISQKQSCVYRSYTAEIVVFFLFQDNAQKNWLFHLGHPMWPSCDNFYPMLYFVWKTSAIEK